jgi:hypothetical protein
MQVDLTAEQRHALNEGRGFVEGPSYVLMSPKVFRDMMGVGTDEEYQAALDAIDEAVQAMERGQGRPIAEFFREFDERHGIHG